MADKYFAEYTEIKVKQFRETLLQHMSNVKKSVAERTRHQRQYDRRLTESEVQDTSIRSGNDIDNDDAEIRLIYDEEPMAEEQLTIECNIFATRQHHTEQLEIINEASPRSDLRWKRTGKILNTVGLRLVPTGKIFTSCTSKADSESTHGLNVDISKIHECKQTIDLSVGKSQSVVAKKADISKTNVIVDSQMMNQNDEKSFWGYALESAAHILNMVPTKKIERMPYEIWQGKDPKLSYLRVCCYEALVKRRA
uniref:Retrotransposon protein, putative, Ty1-copia subclass n=1 Tax=Tanacetum cinerariifolium TaxID=118510 RepID=A0A6L2NHP7_TANCI|nr:retrotransposon protein, putative, Ty1-copia subclass [Tanacetum cinerariifolium]